jgi:hypothetical protein
MFSTHPTLFQGAIKITNRLDDASMILRARIKRNIND